MGIILDSSILIAYERRRFDLERLLTDHPSPAIAAITAAEPLIGVERADTVDRRARREAFVQNIFARVPIIPFDQPQARLYAIHFADLTECGELIGERDLQIAVTALSLDFEIATRNIGELRRDVRAVNAAAPCLTRGRYCDGAAIRSRSKAAWRVELRFIAKHAGRR